MALLPSLADIIFVVVLLVPGFIALILLRWIAIFESELSDSRLVIWSLFLSLLIYCVFGWLTGMSDFDTIRDKILLPQNLAGILAGALLLGVVPGILIRVAFRKRIVRGDSWEASMKEASRKGSWVIIYTLDGREYKGLLHYSGGKGFPKEISIRQPKQIFRDSKGFFEEEVEVGKELLFSEKDVARVAFFEEV